MSKVHVARGPADTPKTTFAELIWPPDIVGAYTWAGTGVPPLNTIRSRSGVVIVYGANGGGNSAGAPGPPPPPAGSRTVTGTRVHSFSPNPSCQGARTRRTWTDPAPPESCCASRLPPPVVAPLGVAPRFKPGGGCGGRPWAA